MKTNKLGLTFLVGISGMLPSSGCTLVTELLRYAERKENEKVQEAISEDLRRTKEEVYELRREIDRSRYKQDDSLIYQNSSSDHMSKSNIPQSKYHSTYKPAPKAERRINETPIERINNKSEEK